MQAQLNLSEFSYLLHTLGAKQVVGIHNEAAFPDDETTKDALLSQGFGDLQKDGWLVSQNNTFQTNAELLLLVAVIAAPENTVMLTKKIADETRQTVTYYQSQGIFVEQLFTAEKKYLLTRLDSLNSVIERLTLAMDIPEHVINETAVSLQSAPFEDAMEQAQSGDLSALTTLLTANGLAESEATQAAAQISQLQAAGNIEIASFSEEQVRDLNQIIILKNETGVWALSPTDQPETLQLQTVEVSSFSRMIQTIINS